MAIPVVDLAEFLSGDTAKKAAFVQQLGKAYEDTGFVAVKNHGISNELITELYKNVQQFFSMPIDIKKKYEKPELAGQRGYTHRSEKNMRREVKLRISKSFFNSGKPSMTMIL